MKCIPITIILILVAISVALAVSVDENDVIISSDDTFYCQNIISDEGCLFKTYVDITNNRVSTINPKLEFDADKIVSIRGYYDDDHSIGIVNKKGKHIHSTNPITIPSGQEQRIYIDFYAKETGKFNFSVSFSGIKVTLDPFFNLTSNVTSPSIHLIEGNNNTIPDYDYLSTSDITSGLSDDSDITTFLTNSKQLAEAIYKLDEGSGSNIEDSSGNENDGTAFGTPTYIGTPVQNSDYALDFDGLNDRLNIPDNGQFQFGNSVTDVPFTMMAWINITDMTTFRIAYKYVTFQEFIWGFTGGDNILLWLQDQSTSGYLRADSSLTQTSKQNTWFHLTTVYNGNSSDEGIQHYINGSPISMSYLGSGTYVAMEDTGEDVDIAYGGGANYGEGALDEFYVFKEALNQTQIQDIVDNGLRITTNAIKPNFNITIDSDNDYWLRTRKTSTGVDSISIYIYENETDIDLASLDSDTITTGWDVTKLQNSAINDSNATFRFYTDDRAYFSEVQLIEGINDSIKPTIADEQINDTVLDCSDYIRLEANITDDYFIDHVFFTYNDNNGEVSQEADKLIDTDIYYVDLQYVHSTYLETQVFNFSGVNATDLGGNLETSSINIPFNYTCTEDTVDPVINPQSGGVFDTTQVSEFNYSTGCYDFSPHNFTLRIHNESDNILSVSEGTLLNEINITISGSMPFSGLGFGEYTINHTCNDSEGNQAEDNRVLIITNETIDAFNLIAPSNNSLLLSQEVDFTFNIATSATAELFINGSLSSTISAIPGINTFPVQTLANGSYSWYVNATKGTANVLSDTWFLTINDTLGQDSDVFQEDVFSMFSCPSSLELIVLLAFFMILSFGVMIIGYVFKSGLIGVLGAFMLLFMSFYIYACIFVIGTFLTILSLVMGLYFTSRGIRAFD